MTQNTQPTALKPAKRSFFQRLFGPRRPYALVIRLAGFIGHKSYSQGSVNFEELREPLKDIFEHKPDVVCLLINSPGGVPGQTSLLADYIRDLADKHKIPVWAFVEDVAASGGYWLACAADEIFALETSILGSIGVLAAGFGFPKLMEKIGVERRVYTAGKHKVQLDAFLPERPADIERIREIQRDIHESFISYVKSRRGSKLKASDDELFQADIWSGKKAIEMGIIDQIGWLESVLYERLGKKVNIKYYILKGPSFFRRFFCKKFSIVDELSESIEAQSHWMRYRL